MGVKDKILARLGKPFRKPGATSSTDPFADSGSREKEAV